MSSDEKLIFLIRHGEAFSNLLQEELGPDVWYNVVSGCDYTADNGTHYEVFDAGE